MASTTITGRGIGDSKKSLKPVLDDLIVQFNVLKRQIQELQEAIDEGGSGIQTDFAGNDVTMNAAEDGVGGTFFTNGGRIAFDDGAGDNLPGYIQTGSATPYGGIGIICMVGYECNWQSGVLKLNGPGPDNSGAIVLGSEVVIVREPNDGGPSILRIVGATLQLSDIPEFADNASALTGNLPLNSLYRTSTGELRIVMGA